VDMRKEDWEVETSEARFVRGHNARISIEE